jgi:hypothetical protein
MDWSVIRTPNEIRLSSFSIELYSVLSVVALMGEISIELRSVTFLAGAVFTT